MERNSVVLGKNKMMIDRWFNQMVVNQLEFVYIVLKKSHLVILDTAIWEMEGLEINIVVKNVYGFLIIIT